MTVYPFAIDGDAELTRVDDNLTEIGDTAINQLREAVFAIEEELGIRPSGTAGSLVARLDAFSNSDGTIKASALASIALATLPITNNQVAPNAGIDEFKLNLDYSTSDLYSLSTANQSLLNSLTAFANATASDLSTHISGGQLTSSGSPARHVASHIDLNDVPSDLKDPLYSWTGLLDKDGVQRSATTVADGLLEINNDFTSHQNSTSGAHVASAISIDVDDFEEIPQTIDDVQKLADHIDDFEVITVGEHRATQHANGIPQIARINGCGLSDGYSQIVVPATPAITYLVTNPNITSVDDISTGDDLVKFSPNNSSFIFDSQFSQIRPGDLIKINYGSGLEATYPIDSIRYVPGSEWVVRLNGVNLMDTVDGYASAMIYRPLFDRNTAGILAVASANATPIGSFNNILSSVIVGNPRGAVAVGNGFDANQLDANHYNLWLEFYPTGNPADHVISLPAIDVTGDAGTSVGKYTLKHVVQTTNNALREIGYNFRMIAFEHEGNFGIMMADAINCASFSITSGSLASGSLIVGTFANNVIGTAAGTDFDALGLGPAHAAWASPSYSSAGTSFSDSTAAQTPTKVIVPYKKRNYIVDGKKRDKFAPTWMGTEDTNGDYYWDGYISARNQIGSFTVETTYTVNLDLKAAGLAPGKTLVVQPSIDFSDSSYLDADYGRFIIKQVNFPPECPGDTAQTSITVINGIHATGSGVSLSSGPELAVKLYFSEDSVGFNSENVINQTPTSNDYHRLHEILIDNQLKTFGHERARMPIQVQTGSKLASSDWHIENVSPKLRGYPDATLDQNKYLRFYILNYNSDTGEYDGYVGKRPSASSPGITSVGPVTRGRKNVPTRFYDETYVDFVDLIFEEDNSTLATASNILSDSTPRYVDIELFPSLRLNDDMLLLATAEVTWDPQTGKEVVQRVIDRRDFGSIDEEDFTESAINFINAGDRHLHENGVIRGYTLDSINPTDNRELFFKGGVALVNGRILTTNNLSVTIPELVYDDPFFDGVPASGTVTWAVCVNEAGFLEPIIVTDTKLQFFGIDFSPPNNSYYLPSVTFAELIDTRKDLTPIAIVTANIASVTIAESDVSDIRRNIFEIGRRDELVLSQDGYAGHFNSFEQTINWINQYYTANQSVKNVTVQVRGTMTVTDSVTLNPVVPVTFRGEGGTVIVTANTGLIVNDNVTFDELYFVYNPNDVTGLSSTNYINTGAGCIYHGDGANLTGLKIKDCKFVSDLSAQRYPFINVEVGASELVSDFVVEGCTFDDPSGDGYRAAVAVVCTNTGAGTEPAYLINSFIRNNNCLQRQGLYITSTDTSGVLDTPGIGTSNVSIRDNSAGVIGYLITSQSSSALLNSSSNGRGRSSSLVIEGNSAHFIGTFLSDGLVASERVTNVGGSGQITYALGNVIISNNTANWIDLHIGDDGDVSSSLVIKDNTLSAYNSSYYSLHLPSSSSQQGIYVNVLSSDDVGSCIISNNNINGTGLLSGGLYNTGILSNGSCKILNNKVNGFTNVGITGASISGLTREYLIQGNFVNRESRTVSRFIFAGNSTDIVTVVDNVLDSDTVDGGSVVPGTSSLGTVIGASSPDRIIERNVNQTESININAVDNVSVGPGSTLGYAFLTNEATVASDVENGALSSDFGTNIWKFEYLDNPSTMSLFLRTSLFSCLPPNVRITDASVTFDTTSDPGGGDSIDGTITIARANTTSVVSGPTAITTAGVTLNVNPGDVRNSAANNLILEAKATVDNSIAVTISVSSITVTYRW